MKRTLTLSVATAGLLIAMACSATAATIQSTDFTGRTVSGTVVSNINWTNDSLSDPGNLTAFTVISDAAIDLWDTTDAQGYMVPKDKPVAGDPQGWYIDIPLLFTGTASLDDVVIDYSGFTTSGAFRGGGHLAGTWTATVLNGATTIVTKSAAQSGGTGVKTTTLTFDSPVNLVSGYTLRLTPTGSNNVLGIDAITLNGTAAIPEPSAMSLAALSLLGLVGFRRRRNR